MERQTTTIDLRGSDASSAAAGFGVLADPTGRRGRRLRRAGHVVAGLFALWLAALVLAGLGLLPAAGVPLASRTGPRTEPPPLDARSPLVSANGSKPAPAARRAAPIATARRSAPTPPAHAPARRREPARRPSVAPLRRKATVVAPPAATRPAGTPAPRPRP